MKKFLYLFLPLTLLGVDMPPMPPMIGVQSKKSNVKNKMPKSCELLPPMLVILPPPLEVQLDKCKNALAKPDIKTAEKVLRKYENKNIKIKKITPAKGFLKIYKIEYEILPKKSKIKVLNFKPKRKSIYCNDTMTQCFENYMEVKR
jgi:hypothetical protein